MACVIQFQLPTCGGIVGSWHRLVIVLILVLVLVLVLLVVILLVSKFMSLLVLASMLVLASVPVLLYENFSFYSGSSSGTV